MMCPDFSASKFASDPFPHMRIPQILRPEEADRALGWMQRKAPWALRVESFYQQYEFSFLSIDPEPEVQGLLIPSFTEVVRGALAKAFAVQGELQLVDIGAHLLRPGQAIRIHNDYLDGEETHRLLIQLNSGWDVKQGGLLMLFVDGNPDSLAKSIRPTHGNGFAFEISQTSFHAVSPISDGERFTLVYTYRRSSPSSAL
jgi:Rps23 Pro-64 3,4-dihydroxylase Tpa1-like proline 4-hydroxylase